VGGLSPLGALVVVTVVLAPLYAFSHAWSWLLNWQDVLTRPGPEDVGVCARAELVGRASGRGSHCDGAAPQLVDIPGRFT